MAEDFDTSWFDLNNYADVEKLGLREWGRQLEIRGAMWNFAKDDPDMFQELCDIWIERIKATPIIPNYKGAGLSWKNQREYNPACFYSVFSTPAIHFWHAPQDDRLGDVWEACSLEGEGKATEDQSKLANTPLDILYLRQGGDGGELANVVIDISASDEQILNDIKIWLSSYRKEVGYHSHEKNFTDKNLAEWTKNRLLPYIDLMLVAKANQAEITQSKIARLIFPDEFDVDIVDRLRRTTKPKAEWLIRDETARAIHAQIEGLA